jgi:hypothetical protein
MFELFRTTVSVNPTPGLKILGLLIVALLLLGCAARYAVHPGALNKGDSAAYDALLVAESMIDQARLDFKAGHLPGSAKPALDALIQSYNVARESWLTYRGAIATNVAAHTYFDQLNKNLTDLSNAIRAFHEEAP